MMLKRLLVLVAALAALFVFAPTASAQQTVPEDCRGAITSPTELADCLRDLQATGGLEVPEECTRFLTTPPTLPDFTGGTGGLPVASLLACLNAIADLVPLPEPEPEPEPEPAAEVGYGYDAGYGYDIGYDTGVPEGGVASGFGPTDPDAAGAPLIARGGALLAVLGVLATGLLMMRRRHGS